MKKILLNLLAIPVLMGGLFLSDTMAENISTPSSSQAANIQTRSLTNTTEISQYAEPLQVFVRESCAHCHNEKKFLEEHKKELAEKNIQIKLVDINKNFELFTQFSEHFDVFGTPITLAGDRIFQGYNNDSTGNAIIKAYEESHKQFSFESALASDTTEISEASSAGVCTKESTTCSIVTQKIQVPLVGEVQVTGASVETRYIASFFLGLFDGFNPCAMWVLTVFLIALIQVGDKMKMIFVAGTFILAEAVMYGLILILWTQFFNVISIQYEAIVNIAVGIISLGAGLFFLYEGFFSDGTCKVTNLNQQRTISQKISHIAHSPLTWVSFFGILALAFSVNIIEFACSAGYPQIFAKILMPSFAGDFINQSGIILTYLVAYILDDLIIFGIAVYSIEKISITQKYARGFNILGGLLMFTLGILMIFAPAILKGFFG